MTVPIKWLDTTHYLCPKCGRPVYLNSILTRPRLCSPTEGLEELLANVRGRAMTDYFKLACDVVRKDAANMTKPIEGATPRPWIAGLHHSKTAIFDTKVGALVASLGFEDEFTKTEVEANAELIVRAVNSFEAMREALREVLDGIGIEESQSSAPSWYEERRSKLRIKILAALALAEGKEGA